MSGFVQIRRGFLEHVEAGRIGGLEAIAYLMMIMKADRSTGIWWGSAKALAAMFGRGDVSERAARTLLENLESSEPKYIKRFAVERGRGNYPILINKYECSDGAQINCRLNAEETKDWRNPVYSSSRRERAVEGAARRAAVAPSQERELELTPENPSAEKQRLETKNPIDIRHAPVREIIQKAWCAANPNVPTAPWDGRTARVLSALLKATPSWKIEHFLNAVSNWSKSETNHSESPTFWVSRLPSYAGGPLDRFGKRLDSRPQPKTFDMIKHQQMQNNAQEGDALYEQWQRNGQAGRKRLAGRPSIGLERPANAARTRQLP